MEFSLQILYGFQSPGPVNPQSGVVRTADGSFYGVTPEGGGGYGALYRIGPDGQLTVLTVFDNAYGLYPSAGLVMGNDGALYGAPAVGDVFFRVTTEGGYTNICTLFGGTNGYALGYAMIMANDGNFYGTTTYGGAGYSTINDAYNGGTVFRLTPSGTFTLLNSFVGTNGFQPIGRLMQSTNGNIYGVTAWGGQF